MSSDLELIKDFLKSRGFKSTLECLEKEEKYLDIEKNYSKVKYLLLTFLGIYEH